MRVFNEVIFKVFLRASAGFCRLFRDFVAVFFARFFCGYSFSRDEEKIK
jgi:hypothetical protein